jgi:hypothetical protein
VAGGTYKPAHIPATASTTTYRDRTFWLKEGVKLYGGFAGTETARTQRDWASNVTILSGDFSGDDTVSGSGKTLSITGSTENAYHVVLGLNIPDDGSTVLDGFTLKGGNANGSGSITVGGKGVSRSDGGGMSNGSSSPVLTNVIITGNRSGSIGGGGMYNSSSSPVLTNVTITGNSGLSEK